MSEPTATVPAHHHMPAAVSLNLLRLRRDLTAVDGFNAKVALLLTRVVGTMWAFWAFNGIALVSLPSAIHQHSLTVLINWVSSNWIQLILLPAIMVGQRLQAVAADARSDRQFQDTEVIVDRLDTRTQGGITEILDDLHSLEASVADLAQVVQQVMAARAEHDSAVSLDAKAARTAAESAFVATQAVAAVMTANTEAGAAGTGRAKP